MKYAKKLYLIYLILFVMAIKTPVCAAGSLFKYSIDMSGHIGINIANLKKNYAKENGINNSKVRTQFAFTGDFDFIGGQIGGFYLTGGVSLSVRTNSNTKDGFAETGRLAFGVNTTMIVARTDRFKLGLVARIYFLGKNFDGSKFLANWDLEPLVMFKISETRKSDLNIMIPVTLNFHPDVFSVRPSIGFRTRFLTFEDSLVEQTYRVQTHGSRYYR